MVQYTRSICTWKRQLQKQRLVELSNLSLLLLKARPDLWSNKHDISISSLAISVSFFLPLSQSKIPFFQTHIFTNTHTLQQQATTSRQESNQDMESFNSIDDLLDDHQDEEYLQTIAAQQEALSVAARQEADDKPDSVDSFSVAFNDFLLKPELIRAVIGCGFERPSEGM